MKVSVNIVLSAIVVTAVHVGDSIAQKALSYSAPASEQSELSPSAKARQECYDSIYCPVGDPAYDNCFKMVKKSCNGMFKSDDRSGSGSGCEPGYEPFENCDFACPDYISPVTGCDRSPHTNSCERLLAQCKNPKANIVPTTCGCLPDVKAKGNTAGEGCGKTGMPTS